MASTRGANCANCGIESTLKCSGCIDAPEYSLGDLANIMYCSRDCQKDDWPKHKARCRVMAQRKRLLRVANILKATLLTYREVIFDVDLIKMEFANGTLRLYQNQRAVTARRKWGPFPSHLTSDVHDKIHKEAALANNQCTTAMALLGPLTRKLLKGLVSTIELLDIYIGNPVFRTRLVPGPDSGACPHTVLRLRSHVGGETWIIDTSGCQYGFRDTLVPYEKYFSDKDARIVNQPQAYDATETKDLDYFSTLPFLNITRAQKEDWRVERRARLHFASFASSSHVGQDILSCSVKDFEERFDALRCALKAHMLLLGL